MTVMWVGVTFLVFLALDVWNRRKTKHKIRKAVFMAFEGAVVLGCFAWYVINRILR